MDKLMSKALTEFGDAMSDLIDACADLAEVEQNGSDHARSLSGERVGGGFTTKGGGVPTNRGGGSWEGAMGYEVVLSRFATARAAYLKIPDRE